jgi:hypothetical protein
MQQKSARLSQTSLFESKAEIRDLKSAKETLENQLNYFQVSVKVLDEKLEGQIETCQALEK